MKITVKSGNSVTIIYPLRNEVYWNGKVQKRLVSLGKYVKFLNVAFYE